MAVDEGKQALKGTALPFFFFWKTPPSVQAKTEGSETVLRFQGEVI